MKNVNVYICMCLYVWSFPFQDWGPDHYRYCLLQCLTSITSTVTLTALARCRWSSHPVLAFLKLTANSWFLPSSVWSIMVRGSENRLLNIRVCAFTICKMMDSLLNLPFYRYRGGLGVYGRTTSPCSTIIQGKLPLYTHLFSKARCGTFFYPVSTNYHI